MQESSLTPSAERLAAHLAAIPAAAPPEQSQAFHVASIGTTFYFAYEQLRNAAEYREHHLLLRSAIERYLNRSVDLRRFRPVGADLITELTQAGYLANDTVPVARVGQIDQLLGRYAELLGQAAQLGEVSRSAINRWVFQIASVQIEDLLAPNRRLAVFMAFAYEHYLGAMDPQLAHQEGENTQAYQIALYCAVQRAIFKSDIATTRYYCLAASLPGLTAETVPHFIAANQLIDTQYQSARTNQLFRLINRYGAPLRILRELVASDSATTLTLANRSETLARIKRICQHQYTLLHKRLNNRIAKTILFVLITKVLIGVALEVPYDIFAHGHIAWLPLMANILFPVVYMILLSLRMPEPDRHDTEAVASFVDRILYQGGQPVEYRVRRRVASSSLNAVFSGIYAVGFLISFGLLSWILFKLDFNIVNGFIFFIFLSAVSFLGFRLRQSARELAMLDERPGVLKALADFLSTPFVRVGHWLSDRYSRLNIVTTILDVMIEMPLKTSLRLIQQWVGFLRDKQEEL